MLRFCPYWLMIHRLATILFLACLTTVQAQFTFADTWGISTVAEPRAVCIQPITLTLTNTSAVTSLSFQYSITNGASFATCAQIPAGGTITVNVFNTAQTSFSATPVYVYSPFTWTGPANSTAPPVEGKSSSKTWSFIYRWGNYGVPEASLPVTIQPATVMVSWGSNSPRPFFTSPILMTFNSGSLTNTGTPAGKPRGELLLMLLNNTGIPRLIKWGTMEMLLSPGSNLIRYDGEVDANGMPLVAPSDFTGVIVTGADGSKTLVANLDEGVEGGVKWGLPPLKAPATPIASPKQDVVEVLTAPTSTKPGTMAIRHPNGAVSLVGIPPLVGATPSNTSGTGATLSDPSLPKPTQSTTNTVTNTTNNTTNNTTITNSTTNTTGPLPTDIPPNTNALNGVTGTDDTSADTALNTALDATRTGIATKQAQGAGMISSKFSGFEKMLAVEAIPKIMYFTYPLDLGKYGSHTLTIDFSKTPFPQVRLAILACMTLMLGNAFMKRVTI